MDKLKIDLPILVEGKYDKITLLGVLDAKIFCTDGFGVFNNKEKQALLRRIAMQKGILVLTDSDGGGRQIRSFLSGILPKEKITMLYIPKIEGKEKRKRASGKSGLLGVEGMSAELLRELFLPFSTEGELPDANAKKVTKTDFYLDGFSGTPDASTRRAALARYFGLPDDMTANALLEAINLLAGYDAYKEGVGAIDQVNFMIPFRIS